MPHPDPSPSLYFSHIVQELQTIQTNIDNMDVNESDFFKVLFYANLNLHLIFLSVKLHCDYSLFLELCLRRFPVPYYW